MASRLNKRQQDSVRELIRTKKLINSLQEHVLEDRQLTDSQRNAAQFLINKTTPNAPTITAEMDAADIPELRYIRNGND